MKTKINEIFASIQGEGPVVGFKQLFIRFCGCNINCDYCDTEFQTGTEYTPAELAQKITSEYNLKTFHSISLTGGEPLLSAEFLKEFLPLIKEKTKIYLETNATMPEKFELIKNYIDIIAADIKLKSSSGKNTFEQNACFFEKCQEINTFAKIVFNENIEDEEIRICSELGKRYNIELVLQPEMEKENRMRINSKFCSDVLEKFTGIYPNTRLIPQVHKFIDVR